MRVWHADVHRGLGLGSAQWALRGRAGGEGKRGERICQSRANLSLDGDQMIHDWNEDATELKHKGIIQVMLISPDYPQPGRLRNTCGTTQCARRPQGASMMDKGASMHTFGGCLLDKTTS